MPHQTVTVAVRLRAGGVRGHDFRIERTATAMMNGHVPASILKPSRRRDTPMFQRPRHVARLGRLRECGRGRPNFVLAPTAFFPVDSDQGQSGVLLPAKDFGTLKRE